MEAFEQKQRLGTHSLIDSDVYVPAEEPEHTASATSHVLGGSTDTYSDDPKVRRARVLEATMRRLERVENDIEKGCGSTS